MVRAGTRNSNFVNETRIGNLSQNDLERQSKTETAKNSRAFYAHLTNRKERFSFKSLRTVETDGWRAISLLPLVSKVRRRSRLKGGKVGRLEEHPGSLPP